MSSKNLTLKSVLVSGGGLAGPAIATLLARDGVDVTVIEIADGVRPGGQAVDIRGAGRSVLSRMGLLDRARAMRLQQRGIADVDSQGRRRTEMTVEDFGGEGMISEIEILRGDLAQLLVDASVEAGASYVFSTRISSLDIGPHGVDVTLSDGTERTADLVIGADGPHSATRRLTFGPEDSFVHPIGGYMAWFTAPEPATLDGWYQMFNAPGGLVASLRPGREPGVAKASLSFASDPLACDRHDLEAQRRLLNDRFAGLGWRVPDLLRAVAVRTTFTSMPSCRCTWTTGPSVGSRWRARRACGSPADVRRIREDRASLCGRRPEVASRRDPCLCAAVPARHLGTMDVHEADGEPPAARPDPAPVLQQGRRDRPARVRVGGRTVVLRGGPPTAPWWQRLHRSRPAWNVLNAAPWPLREI
jgi:2-polyprenyl-6-methoxyphenol hydroxylase-like FAD-dependent oxidoreductase